jgi:uncharacterized protein (DUF1778 family)
MSDDTTPSPGLREQIAQALVAEHHRRTRQGLLTSPEIHNTALADAVMLVVQPALSQRDAELRRLHTLFDEAQESLPIEQRRLLAISRMVFDRHAEGDTLSRDDAADLAQRIVDEIGHSVTEEPALGPSFRVEIRRLQDLISRMRADYHTEISQRAEAYQSAIASTAGDAMEHRLCGMNLHAAIRRAEQAETANNRVRVRAEQWAALAPADDWGDSTADTLTADHGRAILADLDQPGEPT